MRELARLGFVLVGLHIAFSGLAALVSSLEYLRHDDLGFAPVSIVLQLLSVVAPGLALVVFNRSLSAFLFKPTEVPATGLNLAAAGLAAVGAYLVVLGTSAALSLLLMAVVIRDPLSGSNLNWGYAIRGLFEAVFGALLFRYPQEALERLGRLDRARAA